MLHYLPGIMADNAENAENGQAAANARRRPTIAPMSHSVTVPPMKTRPPMTPLPTLAPKPPPVVAAAPPAPKKSKKGLWIGLLFVTILAGAAGAWLFM
jgi:hypothetical protein